MTVRPERRRRLTVTRSGTDAGRRRGSGSDRAGALARSGSHASWTRRTLLESGRVLSRERRTPAGRLRHYARRFGVSRSTRSYYVTVGAERIRLAERTRRDFRFGMRVPRRMTGIRSSAPVDRDLAAALPTAPGGRSIRLACSRPRSSTRSGGRFRCRTSSRFVAARKLAYVLVQICTLVPTRRRTRLDTLEAAAARLPASPVRSSSANRMARPDARRPRRSHAPRAAARLRLRRRAGRGTASERPALAGGRRRTPSRR